MISCLAIGFGAPASSYRNALRITNSREPRTQPEVAVTSQPLPAHALAGTAQSAEKPGVEVITMSADGFAPAAITRRKGMVCLIVANDNSYEEAALVLDRVGGSRLSQTAIPPRQPRWGEWFDLLPGEYVLSDQLHPERICHITVSAK